MKVLHSVVALLVVAVLCLADADVADRTEKAERDPLLGVAVHRLRRSDDGRIWAATAEGVHVCVPGGERWERLTGHPLLDGPANDVLVTSTGELWVATDQGVLVRRGGDFEAHNAVPLQARPEQETTILSVFRTWDVEWNEEALGRVLCLAEDHRGRIWAGTATGPVEHEPESGRWTAHPVYVGEWVWQGVLHRRFLPFPPCRNILEDGDGRLWCLTDGRVAVATRSNPWFLWEPGWRVSGPAAAAGGTYVWFGPFFSFTRYGEAAALALGPDRQARVLGHKGMVVRPPEVPTSPDPTHGYRILRPNLDRPATDAAATLSAVTALAYGRQRIFVAGTADGRAMLAVADLATGKRDTFALEGTDGAVRDLLYDPSGVLWVGTRTGVFRADV